MGRSRKNGVRRDVRDDGRGTSLNALKYKKVGAGTTALMLAHRISENRNLSVDVYKRANLDRKLFSKTGTGKDYTPSKKTAVALAVAPELNLDETDDLLERAGYAFSRSQKFDVIVEYFIVSGKYDIFEINNVLFKYDQPLLGG
jgi:hypothetical protein